MIARLRRLVAAALGQSSPLVLARLASVVLTFALPLVLVRLLEPATFGTYKQFFLIGQTVLLVGQLGLTQSLYYFLPRGGGERGTYLTHALFALAGLGLLFGAGLWALSPWLGARVGSGELATLRLPLGIYASAMLAAAPLEGALTSEGKIGKAAIAYVLTDAVRAAALVGAARLLGPHALFWAAAVVALARVGGLALCVARRVLPSGRVRRALIRPQLAFALPFAGATWFYVGQRYFSQYAVAAHFDATTFALFAVASFHMPVVDIVYTPITEVLMVRLRKAASPHGGGVPAEWDDAVGKLASILFPAAVGAWLLGPVVLPLLFTQKYAGAVPLFLIATFEIPLWVLPVDALLRAAGDTRFLFVFSAARVLVTGGLVVGGIATLGLPGALAGAITSEALARLGMLARGCRHLGVPLSRALDGALLGRIAGAAAGASLPALGVRFAFPPGVPMVITTFAVYGAAYLALRLALVPRARARAQVACSV